MRECERKYRNRFVCAVIVHLTLRARDASMGSRLNSPVAARRISLHFPCQNLVNPPSHIDFPQFPTQTSRAFAHSHDALPSRALEVDGGCITMSTWPLSTRSSAVLLPLNAGALSPKTLSVSASTRPPDASNAELAAAAAAAALELDDVPSSPPRLFRCTILSIFAAALRAAAVILSRRCRPPSLQP